MTKKEVNSLNIPLEFLFDYPSYHFYYIYVFVYKMVPPKL